MKTTIRKNRMGVIGIAAVIIACAMILVSASAFAEVQLTNNAVRDKDPSMHSGAIAWEGRVGSYYQIFYWDGTSTTQITNNATSSSTDPSLYNGTIAWSGYDSVGFDYEIYFWNGTTVTNISDNAVQDSNPVLYDGTIAWEGSDGDVEIMYWNGNSITQITNNVSGSERDVTMYNGTIAWTAYDEVSDNEIFYWDGTSITQITDNEVHDEDPSLYNGTIAWENGSGSTQEIYYWDGSSITNITNNNPVRDYNPSLYNGTIAWERYDSVAGTDAIYYWDGSSITQITTNPIEGWAASLYDGMVACQGDDGSDDEIYYASVTSPVEFDSIAAAIAGWGDLDYSLNEVNQLLQLYEAGTGSVVIQGTTWVYYAELPDQAGKDIGQAYTYLGSKYIYLGSGVGEGGGGAPELPAGAAPIIAMIFSIGVIVKRKYTA